MSVSCGVPNSCSKRSAVSCAAWGRNEKMPPPQLPPDVQAQVQLGQQEIQRKAQFDQGKLQIEQSKVQMGAQEQQAGLAIETEKLQFEQAMAQQAQHIEAIARQLAQQVEIQKNDADNRQKQMTELLKNNEDNRTNMMIEQMRQEGLMMREELAQQMREYQTQVDALTRVAIAENVAKANSEKPASKEKGDGKANP